MYTTTKIHTLLIHHIGHQKLHYKNCSFNSIVLYMINKEINEKRKDSHRLNWKKIRSFPNGFFLYRFLSTKFIFGSPKLIHFPFGESWLTLTYLDILWTHYVFTYQIDFENVFNVNVIIRSLLFTLNYPFIAAKRATLWRCFGIKCTIQNKSINWIIEALNCHILTDGIF